MRSKHQTRKRTRFSTAKQDDQVYIHKVQQWVRSGSFVLPDLVAEEERYQFQSDLELDSPAGDFETKLVSWKRFRKIILSGKLRLQLLRNQADDTGTILVRDPSQRQMLR